MNVFEQVEKNIDALVTGQADWTVCASQKELDNALSDAETGSGPYLIVWEGQI